MSKKFDSYSNIEPCVVRVKADSTLTKDELYKLIDGLETMTDRFTFQVEASFWVLNRDT